MLDEEGDRHIAELYQIMMGSGPIFAGCRMAVVRDLVRVGIDKISAPTPGRLQSRLLECRTLVGRALCFHWCSGFGLFSCLIQTWPRPEFT